MSWTTLLTALSLAAGTAYLVVFEHWSFEAATRTMLGVAFALLVLLTAMIFWLMPVSSRAEFWNVIKVEILKEFKTIKSTFWKKL